MGDVMIKSVALIHAFKQSLLSLKKFIVQQIFEHL